MCFRGEHLGLKERRGEGLVCSFPTGCWLTAGVRSNGHAWKHGALSKQRPNCFARWVTLLELWSRRCGALSIGAGGVQGAQTPPRGLSGCALPARRPGSGHQHHLPGAAAELQAQPPHGPLPVRSVPPGPSAPFPSALLLRWGQRRPSGNRAGRNRACGRRLRDEPPLPVGALSRSFLRRRRYLQPGRPAGEACRTGAVPPPRCLAPPADSSPR